MMRAILLAACISAPLLGAGPGVARGPDAGCFEDSPQVPAVRRTVEHGERPAWRGRLTEWLRRHVRGDGEERVLYYLRSPLLYAFGPDQGADCAGAAEAAAVERCADIIVDTHTDAQLEMEVALPQLGASTARDLELAVRRVLASGEPVVVRDRAGHDLEIYPALTRRVRVEACS